MFTSHRLLRCVTITRLYSVGSIGGHNFRDGLQDTGRIGMSKIHKTWDSDGFGSCICSTLSGLDSVSSPQTKPDELKTGNRGTKAF